MYTLGSEGFVNQDSITKRYRLGARILGFNKIITDSLEIHQEALPILNELVKKTNETAHISVLEGNGIVYLHKVEPIKSIRVFTEIGKAAPCYCIAGGKAILAHQTGDQIESVIAEGLKPYTNKTITDPEEFRNHLKEIKSKGFAISHGEYLKEGEILSIASPIFDYTGRAFASVSLVGIAEKITQSMLDYNISQVKKAAKIISKNLGYYQ